jgi:hypothetical protein
MPFDIENFQVQLMAIMGHSIGGNMHARYDRIDDSDVLAAIDRGGGGISRKCCPKLCQRGKIEEVGRSVTKAKPALT